MNPLTKVKLINELNEREHQLGVKETVSWHSVYKDSAWIFVGGFPYELTEGDIICVFSQYGEVVNINLVRDKKTGKSKGFCFICYEDQRSTILAVDNFNGIKIKGRTIRVDHVSNYRPPKDTDDMDDITRSLREEGCAPKPPDQSLSDDEEEEEEEEVEEQYVVPVKKSKKDKKEKKKKKKKEKKEKRAAMKEEHDSSSSSPPPPTLPPAVTVKEEKHDAGYDRHIHKRAQHRDGSGPAVTEQRNPRGGDEGFHGRHGDNDDEEEEEERRRRREGDRVRDSDRQRETARERDSDRQRERDRAQGSDRERDVVKSHKERERDYHRDSGRERERDYHRDSGRERERDYHRDSGREREGDREGKQMREDDERERDRKRDRGTDRERDRGTDRERERDRSSRCRDHSGDRDHRKT